MFCLDTNSVIKKFVNENLNMCSSISVDAKIVNLEK